MRQHYVSIMQLRNGPFSVSESRWGCETPMCCPWWWASSAVSTRSIPQVLNFRRLVLGCINADFGNKIVIFQGFKPGFSRSTRFKQFYTVLHRSKLKITSLLQSILSKKFEIFADVFQNVQILPKSAIVRGDFHRILLCSISTFCYFQIPCFHFHITLFKQILEPELRDIKDYCPKCIIPNFKETFCETFFQNNDF